VIRGRQTPRGGRRSYETGTEQKGEICIEQKIFLAFVLNELEVWIE
jgi:hypothetical protein